MTSKITLKVPGNTVRFVPTAVESRAKAVYQNGLRTDRTQTDEKGRTLFGFAATVELGGERFAAQMTSPTPLPEALPLGVVFVGVGTAALTVLNQREAFDLRVGVAVEDYEPAKS